MKPRHDDPRSDGQRREIEIEAGGARLSGDLVVPSGAVGVVLFAHGSGSSRHSPRNRAVARTLAEAGLATLLLDLLTPSEDAREEAGAMMRFDVTHLADRLVSAIDWLANAPQTRALPLGIFGASTGAAAALIAAAARPVSVRAVVSRGGRPDLADRALEHVHCPTLLIVGGDDEVVLDLNRYALRHLSCTRELAIVPGATHLFEEPGAMQDVSRLATDWFVRHLVSRAAPNSRPAAGPRAAGGADRASRSTADGRPGTLSMVRHAVDQDSANGPRLGVNSIISGEGPDPRTPDEEPRPEITPQPHEPAGPRPDEAPERHEPPFQPAPPSPRPPPPAPEVRPIRG